MSNETVFSVSGAEFARAVLAVEKSAAHDDSRPALAGIQMEITKESVTFVAADGYRLAFAHAPYTASGDCTLTQAILRHASLVAFARKAKSAAYVEFSRDSDNAWRFRNLKTGESVIIPVIDATYPAWRGMTDPLALQACEEVATFNARYLAEAAATAPRGTNLSIERKTGASMKDPGVMRVRSFAGDVIATHVIMPMVVGY